MKKEVNETAADKMSETDFEMFLSSLFFKLEMKYNTRRIRDRLIQDEIAKKTGSNINGNRIVLT